MSEEQLTYLATDVPTPARMYDYCLGGKDNFEIDRNAVITLSDEFPEGIDTARENRRFLYRVVRYLTDEAGVGQFLDMGSGLPAQQNVHQVARQFQPDARVVYVDNDPIVLAHGRALLADEASTIVITADMTEPEEVLSRADVHDLIDFDRPVAALFLSVPHSIPDDEVARGMLQAVVERLAPGSFVAVSQFTAQDRKVAVEHSELCTRLGLDWKTRAIEDFRAMLEGLGLEPVPPGLVEVTDWRPDPDQPALSPVAPQLRRYVGAAANNHRVREFGGVLRKP